MMIFQTPLNKFIVMIHNQYVIATYCKLHACINKVIILFLLLFNKSILFFLKNLLLKNRTW